MRPLRAALGWLAVAVRAVRLETDVGIEVTVDGEAHALRAPVDADAETAASEFCERARARPPRGSSNC